MKTPTWCRQRAAKIGTATEEIVRCLMDTHPLYKLRTVQAILRLADRYGTERLEAASARCLAFDELSYKALRRILDKGLDKQPAVSTTCVKGGGCTFARSAADFHAGTDTGRTRP